MMPQPPVQDELVGSRRHRGRRGADLIQEQDPLPAVTLRTGEHGRNRPLHVLAGPKWDAAQVARLHLGQPDVDHGNSMPGRHLGDDLGLAYARGAPDHHRRVVTLQGAQELTVEDGEQVSGTHNPSSLVA